MAPTPQKASTTLGTNDWVDGLTLIDPSTGITVGNGGIVQLYTKYPSLSDELSQFSFNIAQGDLVIRDTTTNGGRIIGLSTDPTIEGSHSVITMKNGVASAHYTEAEITLSQRIKGIYGCVGAVSTADPMQTYDPTPIQITAICQSNTSYNFTASPTAGTNLSIQLATPFQGYAGDWVSIYGVTDTRMNYANLLIIGISKDRLTIVGNMADENTLPSLAVGTINPAAAFIQPYIAISGAMSGYEQRYSGAVATSAAQLVQLGGVPTAYTFYQNQLNTTGSSALIITSGGAGRLPEFRPTVRTIFSMRPESLTFYDIGSDTAGNQYMQTRARRTGTKPLSAISLYPRFRVRTPKSISRPVAKITSITRVSGTVTVTTTQPHNLVSGNYVTLKGIRDTSIFPHTTTPIVINVTGATTFTATWANPDGTSTGGSVILCNGSLDMAGQSTQTIQSVATDTANQQLTITGSASWTGISVGELVNLHGVVTTGSVDMGYDGAWRVLDISTTTMLLGQIVDAFGITQSPTVTNNSANAGGIVILRTTLRIHDMNVTPLTQNEVSIMGQGTDDLSLALPVRVAANANVAQASSSMSLASDGTGGWYTRPSILTVADQSSSAITSTTNSTAITNSAGNAFQITYGVSAVSGTNPTLDVTIQESDDGGVNWYDIYQFQRITAAITLRSPLLISTGRSYRLVQTIGGTSPSFTRTYSRTLWPSSAVHMTRRRMDYALAVNTLSSTTTALYIDGCRNVQLQLNLGAVTTSVPTLKLQGSEDNVNWYDMPSGSVAGVASSGVQVTVANVQAAYVRAIVSVAGVGATLVNVSVKAWE